MRPGVPPPRPPPGPPPDLGAAIGSIVAEVVFDYNPDSGDDVESAVSLVAPNAAPGQFNTFHKYAAAGREA